MAPPRDRGGAALAAGLALVAAWALWTTREFSLFGSIFPRTAGVVLLVGSLAVVVRELRGRDGAPPRRWQGVGRGVALVAVMAAWIASLEWVGFAASSGLAFVLLAALSFGTRPTLRQAVLGAVAAGVLVLGLQLVFERVLSVKLPAGTLWPAPRQGPAR